MLEACLLLRALRKQFHLLAVCVRVVRVYRLAVDVTQVVKFVVRISSCSLCTLVYQCVSLLWRSGRNLQLALYVLVQDSLLRFVRNRHRALLVRGRGVRRLLRPHRLLNEGRLFDLEFYDLLCTLFELWLEILWPRRWVSLAQYEALFAIVVRHIRPDSAMVTASCELSSLSRRLQWLASQVLALAMSTFEAGLFILGLKSLLWYKLPLIDRTASRLIRGDIYWRIADIMLIGLLANRGHVHSLLLFDRGLIV